MAKRKAEREEALFRILVFIVSGIITYVWAYLAYACMLINWLIALIRCQRSSELADFTEYWNTQIYRFWRYMSGVTNERPFPFTKLEKITFFKK